MRLTPRLRHYGSTAVFMRRDEYEPTLRFLAALVEHGDTVYDIGANFGVYSLVLAQRAGRVVAFEPGREAVAQLRRNVSLNPALNVEVVPVALSDRAGGGALVHIGGPATYSLSGTGSSETVDLVTLDGWADASGVMPDLIKIDVEGHEPAVFAGGRGTLERARPLVMFEVSFAALARGGYEADASWLPLASLGYELFRLADGRLRPAGRVQEDNLFAVHPGSAWPERLSRLGILA
jgi:FkbM family methyltransferase